MRLQPPYYRFFLRSFIVSIVVLFSCAPSLYLPTQDQANSAGIPLENLQMGRQLYVDHCGSCHMLYLPNRFSAEVWRAEMDTMAKKASISREQGTRILEYLTAGK